MALQEIVKNTPFHKLLTCPETNLSTGRLNAILSGTKLKRKIIFN